MVPENSSCVKSDTKAPEKVQKNAGNVTIHISDNLTYGMSEMWLFTFSTISLARDCPFAV